MIDQAPSGIALQPDGKIIVFGKTFRVNGIERYGICRLNANGTPDVSFRAATYPGHHVTSVAVQDDGKILVGGVLITSWGQMPKPTVMRYLPDGTRDLLYQSPLLRSKAQLGESPSVRIVLQPDRKLLVTEEVYELGEAKAYLRRLNADGGSDTTFDRGYVIKAGYVRSLAVLRSGQIVAVGDFNSMYVGAGVYASLPNIVRFNSDGSYDSVFVSGLDSATGRSISTVVAQPDGKLLLQGVMSYTGVSGNLQLTRMLADGGRDTTFTGLAVVSTPYPSMRMVLQADQKIILALPGTVPTDVSWPGNLVRLNANGTKDLTFHASTGQNVTAIALQSDGKLVVAGEFSAKVSRYVNDPGTRQLTVPFAGRVRWAQTGGAGMPHSATFDFYNSAGAFVSSVTPVYEVNGWEWTGTFPASRGAIVARAVMGGGQVTQVLPFGTVLSPPEISVERGSEAVYDGSQVGDFGVLKGGAVVRSFTIRNTGAANLTDLALTIDGAHAAHFELIAEPAASLAPMQVATFAIRFRGGDVGTYLATLHITSNDADESSFDVLLRGDISSYELAPYISSDTAEGVVTDGFDATGNRVGDITINLNITASTQLRLVTNQSAQPVVGQFANLPDRAVFRSQYSARLGGEPIFLQVRYDGGDGNDVVLVLVNPGMSDRDFNVTTTTAVYAIAEQPDGRILLGGANAANSALRVMRINGQGQVDPNFNIGQGPDTDTVICVAVQDDGKILVGGGFSIFNGVARSRLVRLHANGEVDPTFNATGLPGRVNSLTILPDQRIIVAGLGGVGIRRLLPDGSDDPTFLFNREDVPTSFTGDITSVAVADDGSLTAVGGYLYNRPPVVPPSGIVILGSENFQFEGDGRLRGKLVTPPNLGISAASVMVQPDGRVILAGRGTRNLARWRSDLTLDIDVGFSNFAEMPVAIQSDGGILSALHNTQTLTSHMYRMSSDGSQDSKFNMGGSQLNSVDSICLLDSGKVLCSGYRMTLEGLAPQIGLFHNDPSYNSISRPSQTSARWVRGGGAPETSQVTFDVSSDNGQSWTSLGAGTRMSDGAWETTGASMPSAGVLRGRARTVGGRYNGSMGLIEYRQPYDSSLPELAVDGPTGSDLRNGEGVVSFGIVSQVSPVTKTFKVRNTIGGQLTGVTATITGGQASDYVITSSPATTVNGGFFTTLSVTFTPGTLGTRVATLQIVSDDEDEGLFQVSLTGTGVTARQSWRQ
ncbi:MAG: choice-of-anchor D domain-containing protein [Verrucomicrobium sp.]